MQAHTHASFGLHAQFVRRQDTRIPRNLSLLGVSRLGDRRASVLARVLKRWPRCCWWVTSLDKSPPVVRIPETRSDALLPGSRPRLWILIAEKSRLLGGQARLYLYLSCSSQFTRPMCCTPGSLLCGIRGDREAPDYPSAILRKEHDATLSVNSSCADT